MNKYYNYKNIELWETKHWVDRRSMVDPLVNWIESNDKGTDEFVEVPGVDPFAHPNYRGKTGCVDLPEITEYWAKKGIRHTILEQGCKYWVSMVPERAFKNREEKLPVVVVFHYENYSDPWWSLKADVRTKKYNDMLAEKQDFILVYLIFDGPDIDRIYFNILQEAFVLYPVDYNRVYFDVSSVYNNGKKLSEIDGFKYINEKYELADPDDCVEKFGEIEIPVLSVGDRWGHGDSLSRGLVMTYRMNEGKFDRQWMVHSAAGKKMMSGIVLEHMYDHSDDEGLVKYWWDLGLKYEEHEKNSEKWTIMVPRQALEEPEKKLPLMIAMQEVYHGNEHLAVTAESYFYEMCDIAAQGECALLFFVLEDPDSNDLLVDIIDDAAEMYPMIDKSRVYVTGHSHDGRFALEFGRRNWRKIAAVATLGNDTGMITPAEWGDPVLGFSDAQLNSWKTIKMPVINLAGCGEPRNLMPKDDEGRAKWVSKWNRRLEAFRCPARTAEEIIATKDSEDKATRLLGVPNDGTELIWADGFEHYIADIKNNDGKNWLRMVLSENMPHTTTPFMLNLAWSFCRRFARDLETGEVIELY